MLGVRTKGESTNGCKKECKTESAELRNEKLNKCRYFDTKGGSVHGNENDSGAN